MGKRKSGFCFSHMVKKTADKGLGVFAGETIKRGSIVWRHVPDQYTVYDKKSFKAAIENMARADVVYELTHVFGLEDMPGCLIRIFDEAVLINHSNNANLATNTTAKIKAPLDVMSAHYIRDVTKALLDVRYALVATRDIELGEEFTNDYAAEVVDPPFYHELCAHYGVREEYLDGSSPEVAPWSSCGSV
ncbi:MAG: SET domain-containing protein [Rhodobacteraceae bacterium]|nr:SET domain-containing protein [Paracoccaceae bacterium]